MIKYFETKDGKEVINPELVTTIAEDAAKSFFPGKEKDNIKASQLRKFYGDVKTMELRLRFSAEDKDLAFAYILPQIKLLKAKANYAHKREVVPKTFKDWLCENVEQINKRQDFEAFLLHFEAVVGFSYGYATSKSFN